MLYKAIILVNIVIVKCSTFVAKSKLEIHG